ncbi:hypothetical protein SHIRM173S_08556 [Streptomyces hirsutus]
MTREVPGDLWKRLTSTVGLVCAHHDGVTNVMSAEWSYFVNKRPLYAAVVLGPRAATGRIVEAAGEFSVTLCAEDQAGLADFAGSFSVTDIDKTSSELIRLGAPEATATPWVTGGVARAPPLQWRRRGVRPRWRHGVPRRGRSGHRAPRRPRAEGRRTRTRLSAHAGGTPGVRGDGRTGHASLTRSRDRRADRPDREGVFSRGAGTIYRSAPAGAARRSRAGHGRRAPPELCGTECREPSPKMALRDIVLGSEPVGWPPSRASQG